MKKILTVLVITIVFGAVVFGATSQVFAKGGVPGNGTSTGTCTGTGTCVGTGTSTGNNYGYQGEAETPVLNQNLYQNSYLYANQTGDCVLGDASCTRTMNQSMSQAAFQQGAFGGQIFQNGNMLVMSGANLVSIESWIDVTATVQSVEDILIVLVLEDGTLINVDGRQLAFLVESGVVLVAGDVVSLTGFYDLNGFFAIGELTLGETTVTLRSDAGLPLWAGGPQRKGGR